MTDHVIQGLGLGGRVRAIAADTSRTVERLRQIHEPRPTATAAMGRVATGALLLASGLEKATAREPLVTLEADGGGPAGRIIATASPRGWLRAWVANPDADAPRTEEGKLDVGAVVGVKGQLIVTRDPGYGEPYRGVVPLFTGEIGEDLAVYLNESEQTPSGVLLGVLVGADASVLNSGGIVVQVLPGVSSDEAAGLTRRLLDLGAVTDRLSEREGPEAWIERIFPGGFEQHQRTEVEFRCGCSLDRVERALKLLGQKEIQSIINDAGDEVTELKCEFCKTVYPVSRRELQRLLDEVRAETTPQ